MEPITSFILLVILMGNAYHFNNPPQPIMTITHMIPGDPVRVEKIYEEFEFKDERGYVH